MAAEHGGLLQDTHFWVLVSTVVFVGIAFVKGKAPILKLLDDRTARIKAELEEAERLRIEAQDLLSDCQKKHRDALQTSQKILDNAREQAERIRKDAEAKLAESLKRREEQLLARIARAEETAVAEIRNQAADLAARAAESLLADTLQKRGGKLVDEAIAEIPSRLN